MHRIWYIACITFCIMGFFIKFIENTYYKKAMCVFQNFTPKQTYLLHSFPANSDVLSCSLTYSYIY